MGTRYAQSSEEERIAIGILLKGGMSIRGISKELLRAPSTISREIRRHFPTNHNSPYLCREAHERAQIRKRECRKRTRLKNPEIQSYVREKLSLGWSPEQISGRLPLEHPHLSVSHEAIYQFVYLDARELLPLLARRHKRRLRRVDRKKRRVSLIPQRIPLLERPSEANSRAEFGHWEIDTMYSLKGAAALLVLTERKTRFVKIAKLSSKRAAPLRKSTVARLAQFPPEARKTLTYDNGMENVEHLLTNKALGTQSYFCAPYHSWEKGTVENTIGILRRYLPKSTNFDAVSKQQVKSLENLLNHRPRKCLKYLTPLEAFRAGCCT